MAEEARKFNTELHYMSTEPGAAPPGARSLMQGWRYNAREPLLDGPVSRRVAVIDFDPATGALVPGARFLAPDKNRKLGRYAVANLLDCEALDFMQVSVFGAVMRMMRIFEEEDVLGRELRWAFDGEQLLVVPRAGKAANAFYHRQSRSLQFFFVDDPARAGGQVYSCLSTDIVAHETTHAILDGIARDLYDATSPQALAMHEAIADLGAVMLAVQTPRLLEQVMELTDGDITKNGAFSTIARQFGSAVYGADRPVRDLANDTSFFEPGGLDLNEPHDLSLVLTGAIYALLVNEYGQIREEDCQEAMATGMINGRPMTAKQKEDPRFSVSGFALVKASGKFKRIAFRALDYLPPGEISFADYGRAMVAADLYSNPEDPEPRDFIKQEFVKRGMVEDAGTLDPVAPGFALPAALDLEQLRDSDWAAYQFAEAHREELRIPATLSFEVRPRLDVTRTTWRKNGVRASTRALLFKVAWQDVQAVQRGSFFSEIAVTRGTTLAIDWETRAVSTLLTTNPLHPSQADGSTAANDAMRLAFLACGVEKGLIEPGSPNVRVHEGRLHLRATGQMLHMMGHDDD